LLESLHGARQASDGTHRRVTEQQQKEMQKGHPDARMPSQCGKNK
jgi:hypothetical protein